MNVSVKELFKNKNNQIVKEFTLKNEYIEVSFINVGASITRFIDLKSGINVVLGYNDYQIYTENPNYFGCVVGRNAGRIENGVFCLDNKKIELSKNFLGKHQLHSGLNGFQRKTFTEIMNEDSISMIAVSNDGEEGFPGCVRLKVTYQLIDNEFHIKYEAKSDQHTIINLTNHTYFNLNRDKEKSIVNHNLLLNADFFLELDPEMIPKRSKSVIKTPFDFRKSKLIGRDLDETNEQIKIGNGYDHPFLLNKNQSFNHVSQLSVDNLTLDVYSDQDAVIVYTGNFLDGSTSISDEKKANYRCAVCLETQGIPNSMHIKTFKDKNYYQKDESYRQHTVWKLQNNSE